MIDDPKSAYKAVELSQNLSPAFPPMTGGSGILFAIGLACAMLTVSWAAAILTRNWRASVREKVPFDHPTAIQYRRDAYLYWAFIFGIGYYVVRWLSWGEVTPHTMAAMGRGEYLVRPVVAVFMLLHVFHGNVTNAIRRFYRIKGQVMNLTRPKSLTDAELRDIMPASMYAELGDYREPFRSPLVPVMISILIVVMVSAVAYLKWAAYQ